MWRANADSAMLNTDLLVVAIAVSTVRLCVRAVLGCARLSVTSRCFIETAGRIELI